MANIINNAEIEKLVKRVIEEDINDALEAATNRVLSEMKSKIKTNIAAQMITLIGSDYNLAFCRQELQIRVKVD